MDKQRTNEEQLDLFADMLEPAAEIFTDEGIVEVMNGRGKPITAVKLAIKNHKSAVIALLASLNGESVDTYVVPGPLAMFSQLMGFVNSKEVQDLFSLQVPRNDAASSGPATENTGDGAI